MALHAAVALLRRRGRRRAGAGWPRSCAARTDPTHARGRRPAGPGAAPAGRSATPSAAADALAALLPQLWRVGGSDAQREVVEETRICALLGGRRYDEARAVIDRRLDRRRCRRDSGCGRRLS